MGQVITNSGKGIILNRAFLATPTLTAPAQFGVGTGTTEPNISDTSLETAIAIDGGSTYFKDFVSGFPALDTVNNQASIRMFLNTLEGNGNDLTEVGSFNNDGTPVLFSRSVFSPLSKTTSVEVTFVEKDKVL